MLHMLLPEGASGAQTLIFAGLALSFLLTFIAIKLSMPHMPTDGGRKFAVNGALSQGKPRGLGLIFILTFILSAAIFLPITVETAIYYGIIILSMLTGYFDDAAEKPWGELKKGILDFIIAVGCGITYVFYNDPSFRIELFNVTVNIPAWLYVILAVILIWAAINVVNCTDGVDGLCGSLSVVTMSSFAFVFFMFAGCDYVYGNISIYFIAAIIAYLWFNASPSKVLMGDAGSRAIGMLVAILALKSGRPLLFIPFAIVFIVDGGLGLIKVTLIRVLKVHILKNTRTPIHDHTRKNKGWSDTQTVFRFVIIQLFVSFLFIYGLFAVRM